MGKTALITGITGQVGSYMAELLLEKGYEVFGLVRRSSSSNVDRIAHIVDQVQLIPGDLTDESSLHSALQLSQPDEVYNLGSQAFVPASWSQPTLTGDVTGLGVARLLEAVRHARKDARVYQASSSEMFGLVDESPQNERTPFHPRSPYGCAKVYAYHMAVNYRESYGMFVCNGIAFNHESPRRGVEFVTRKITEGVAKIHYGLADKITLGNLDAKRDWGFTGDYVQAMWLMLQQEQPDDYVIATGRTHSVREFAQRAFAEVGRDWGEYVVVDEQLFRPAEVHSLCGDASKAKRVLGWHAESTFEDLVSLMVQADLKRVGDQIAHNR